LGQCREVPDRTFELLKKIVMFNAPDAESSCSNASQDRNGFADAANLSDSGEECVLLLRRTIAGFQLNQLE
jgi:hypothetical protein